MHTYRITMETQVELRADSLEEALEQAERLARTSDWQVATVSSNER